jgi:hypothetical protein
MTSLRRGPGASLIVESHDLRVTATDVEPVAENRPVPEALRVFGDDSPGDAPQRVTLALRAKRRAMVGRASQVRSPGTSESAGVYRRGRAADCCLEKLALDNHG